MGEINRMILDYFKTTKCLHVFILEFRLSYKNISLFFLILQSGSNKAQKVISCDNITINLMRHGLRTKRLGRSADQRKAFIRALVTKVLTHGKIKTTMVRAKYIRKFVDKMIALSKFDGIHNRRQMEAFIYNKKLIKSIMVEAPKRYAKRNGGYCRVIPDFQIRRGDAAKIATIELI